MKRSRADLTFPESGKSKSIPDEHTVPRQLTHSSQLALFEPIQENREILYTYQQSYGPTAPLTNRGTITIEVPPSVDDYTSLGEGYFIIKLQVKSPAGPITDANMVKF
jgi:hypothetical protein